MKSNFAVLVAVLFCGVATLAPDRGLGAPLAAVADDLRPLTGVVVQTVGSEVLVDLGEGSGVRTGDLLSVLQPGEKVVHPLTGALLGQTEAVAATLRITKVKPKFSAAVVVSGEAKLSPGIRVSRGAGIIAWFWDYTGQGEEVYRRLQELLPQLEWLGFAAAQERKPDMAAPPSTEQGLLLFILRQSGLEVRNDHYELLGSYILADPTPLANPPSAGIVKSREETAGVWYGPKMAGDPVGVATGDFDGDQRVEIATLFKDRVEFGRIEHGTYQGLGTVPLPSRLTPLHLDAAPTGTEGRPELYVTAVDGEELASFSVEFGDGGYHMPLTGIPWYLRSLKLVDGKTVLLGQRMGPDSDDFTGPLVTLARQGQSLQAGEALDWPGATTIYGNAPFVGKDGDPLLARLSSQDRLQVLSAAGKLLWESGEPLGGSETFLLRRDRTEVRDVIFRKRFLPARLTIGPKGEVLVPVNDGSRLYENLRTFEGSHLSAMVWDGFNLREAWHTLPQGGYLADYSWGDVKNDGGPGAIVMLVGFAHEGWLGTGKRRCTLVVYDMQ